MRALLVGIIIGVVACWSIHTWGLPAWTLIGGFALGIVACFVALVVFVIWATNS